jgi:ferredoxin
VQSDDLLEESGIARDGHFALGMRAKQLASMAMSLNDVYVLQSSGSNLFQFRDRILAGMAYRGPALFSVYSGGPGGSLAPYLVAAAAMESRAFPAYSYDPSAGPNWASRFDLEANTQVESDWPSQDFSYEDENHQRVRGATAFTFADFVACDPRHARHFARVPRAQWSEAMVPLDEYLRRGAAGAGQSVPYVVLVEGDGVLRRAIVDEPLVRAALRCRESWHSLQELGGIHNSHAERLLAKQAAAPAPQAKVPEQPRPEAPAQPAAVTENVVEEKKSGDDPYIETPRCTSCNECTQVNDRMFAYNENKQAYIADPDAGTYAQLVEAAESCQVSIIHPGKPRNPAEPGLAELLSRAEAFA